MSVETELATHSVEIKHIQDDIDRMMDDIKSIKDSLAEINKTLSEAKGGWKTLMWVAGFSSALTGAVIAVIQFFHGK